jgi:CheY-like chemotaxis protein/HPt (histidine-containing phosphotransfer) domain-containing protein
MATDAKVLVVDDNYINLKVALAYLAAHNIHADTAESGAEAIEKVGRRPYDLVFMDHMMPGIDGVEAAKRIRKLDKPWGASMPIIALSANAVSGARETFLDAGMNDFISKPIDAADLNRKLAQWLPKEKLSTLETPAEKKQSLPDAGDQDVVLNRKAGARNIGGDDALYAQIVSAFKEDHYTDPAKISEALAAGDLALAHRTAHTLKSTAGLIGAARLRDAAFALEKALADEKAAPPTELLIRLDREFVMLRGVLDSPGSAGGAHLSPAPGGGTADSGTTGGEMASGETAGGTASGGTTSGAASGTASSTAAGGTAASDREQILDLIDRLLPLLQTGSTRCLELLDEIRKRLAKEDGKGKDLVKQIEDFEFKSALETLLEIKSEQGV